MSVNSGKGLYFSVFCLKKITLYNYERMHDNKPQQFSWDFGFFQMAWKNMHAEYVLVLKGYDMGI